MFNKITSPIIVSFVAAFKLDCECYSSVYEWIHANIMWCVQRYTVICRHLYFLRSLSLWTLLEGLRSMLSIILLFMYHNKVRHWHRVIPPNSTINLPRWSILVVHLPFIIFMLKNNHTKEHCNHVCSPVWEGLKTSINGTGLISTGVVNSAH